MGLTSLLLFVAVLLAAWLLLRKRGKQPEPSDRRRTSSPQRDTTYHAVSIRYAPSACDAAKAMTGRRLLANEAPRLPLSGCDGRPCECRFAHHNDRRTGRDRRSPFARSAGLEGTGAHPVERREGSERRHDDDALF